MRINQNQAICGLRPSVLKALLRRDTFDTPTTMKLLSLDEPNATSTLVELADEGWTLRRIAREQGPTTATDTIR
jgi:hypothetical protein